MKSLFTVLLITLSSVFLLSACGSEKVLTKQEMKIQSDADMAVSEILFDSGLDTEASYNIRKNGHVEIEFTQTVSLLDYTKVIEKLRQDANIKSVYAVQSGSEVCPLK